MYDSILLAGSNITKTPERTIFQRPPYKSRIRPKTTLAGIKDKYVPSKS